MLQQQACRSRLCDCGRLLTNATRRTVTITCTCGRKYEIESGREADHPQQEPKTAPPSQFHAAWKMLHSYQFIDPATTQRWYAQEWLPTIPASCGCTSDWRKITAANPPDFSSREAFFAWTVDRHNDVNRKLGKPEVSLEEAYRLYARWVTVGAHRME